ncbi:hypothetical protein L207DRAFT_590562 [Hyaloscypha variabilis F]|uniref:Uncharacterized protein n=1 Tax=Hyaloscypha variabilis (strain UAMH 11265 / GT02V1 / F) TaxID=1149755 RepID=A0A2J6R171_HYAVF|nr:hypothetical protein L207DRAFT_590562 [Hyaloscypha variabilis F]
MRAPAPAAASAAAGTATNLQTFTGALGGIAADPITQTGNAKTPFAVDGDTFTDFATAATRSCNNQHNSCAQAANAGDNKSLTVGQCDTQQTNCEAAAASAASAAPAVSSTTTSSAEPTLKSADADFFYFCDP